MASILALSCSISGSIPLENKTTETQIEYETTLHARFAMSAVIRSAPSAGAKAKQLHWQISCGGIGLRYVAYNFRKGAYGTFAFVKLSVGLRQHFHGCKKLRTFGLFKHFLLPPKLCCRFCNSRYVSTKFRRS